jgi:hypothetical protein
VAFSSFLLFVGGVSAFEKYARLQIHGISYLYSTNADMPDDE